MYYANLWQELTSYIDDDERLVYPEMYLKHREMYDSVRDIVYLVRIKGESYIDWVPEHYLGKVLTQEKDAEVLSKHLIVRLRLPWEEIAYQWLIDQAELDEFRDHYDILDVYYRVKHPDLDKVSTIKKAKFEQNRDKYELLEALYLVAPKLSRETKARLLGIDPDNIHTYMSE